MNISSIALAITRNVSHRNRTSLQLLLYIFLVAVLCCRDSCWAYLFPRNPPWPPTYNMTESLLTMQLNASGPSSVTRAAQFGIVSYDWSNMKQIWAQQQPMNCEELLTLQARKAKEAGVLHVWVYRNLVKALPWFSTIRTILDDPAYSGFFIHFANASISTTTNYHVPPCAAENVTHCSVYYHDQLQTPQVPTENIPHPDGICVGGRCDCGLNPCGEYLFDHRNGTMLRNFLIHNVIIPAVSETIQHPEDDTTTVRIVDGLFLDDYWCSDLLCQSSHNSIPGCPCKNPIQGPTEVDPFWQHDTGLTDEDIQRMTMEWNTTMTAVETALLLHQSYTWWLLKGQINADAAPTLLRQSNCTQQLQQWCRTDRESAPQLFGLSVVNGNDTSKNNYHGLSQLQQDVAFFLLARGDYAWLGWGTWGMIWPFNPQSSEHGKVPPQPDGVPIPALISRNDFGIPLDPVCEEHEHGVFVRKWSKAKIELDCNRFEATFHGVATYKDDYVLSSQKI